MLSGSILNTFLCYSKLCLGSAISLHCTLLGCGQNGDGKALANDYKLSSNNYQLLCLSCRQKENKTITRNIWLMHCANIIVLCRSSQLFTLTVLTSSQNKLIFHSYDKYNFRIDTNLNHQLVNFLCNLSASS